MPWPTGPISVGVHGENQALRVWVDQPAGKIAGGGPTSILGNLVENLLGHRSGGVNKQAPLFQSPAAAAVGVWTDGGTATGSAAGTLTDANQTWPANQWANYAVLALAAGATGNQLALIASNTATVLTLKSAWNTTPGAITPYTILPVMESNFGATVSYAAGPANALVDTAKAWAVNQWRGSVVVSVPNGGSAEFHLIVSNTATQLTLDRAWSSQPAGTQSYAILMPTPTGWQEIARGGGSTLGIPGLGNQSNPFAI